MKDENNSTIGAYISFQEYDKTKEWYAKEVKKYPNGKNVEVLLSIDGKEKELTFKDIEELLEANQ